MFKKSIFVLTGVCCLIAVALAQTTTRANNSTTTRPAGTNTTRPAATNTTRPGSNANGSSNTTRPATGSSNTTRASNNNSSSSPSSHVHDNNMDLEREAIKVLNLLGKILKKKIQHDSSEEQGSSSEEHGHHGQHHGQQGGCKAEKSNNTYCSFGYILYTEFRKALDSQNLSQIAQSLNIAVSNSSELKKGGFAGLVELFSRQRPELNPFYEQCPRQVNKILADYVSAKTNNSALNFTNVAPFPCTARAMGKSNITYKWDSATRTLQWALSNSTNGSVSLKFVIDGIDNAYNKVNADSVITNFAAKYWAPNCPNWNNDLVEIFELSLVKEKHVTGNRVRRDVSESESEEEEEEANTLNGDEEENESNSEDEESSSEEESTLVAEDETNNEDNLGRRGYGRRGYGRRGYGRRGYGRRGYSS